MFKAVHIDAEGHLLVDRCAYLRKHDIVYHTPALEGYAALPLGNGCFGAMVYHNPDALKMVVNHTSTYDDRPAGRFGAWGWEEEERNTALVSCGMVTVSDGLPSFDRMYLADYEARLRMDEATLTTSSRTPFSTWNIQSYVERKHGVLVTTCTATSVEAISRTVRLERWGSRAFFHYYEQFIRDPSIKLDGTDCRVEGDCLIIRQQLREMSFVVCARLEGGPGIIICRDHSRSGTFQIPSSTQAAFRLLLTVVTSEEADDPLAEAMRRLQAASQDAAILETHRDHWRESWERSFLMIPDDYVENCCYMTLYQMQSSFMGRCIPLLGSIWTWNRDTRNWGHVYHWNLQQQYWPVHAANRPEQAANYYAFRHAMLDHAKADAREYYGIEDGAFYSDISNRHGDQALEPDTRSNFTCGPQIAMDFYRHYQYMMDDDFLRQMAYPVMRACAQFYRGLLKRDEDGTYHLRGATAYEGFWMVDDTITDWAMLQTLLPAVIRTAQQLKLDTEHIPAWQDVLDHLYPMPATQTEIDGVMLPVCAAGTRRDGSPLHFGEGTYPRAHFPSSELAAVFPSGVIGLKDRGTSLFNQLYNTARAVFAAQVDNTGNPQCVGHSPYPQIAARLGMADEAMAFIHQYIDACQCFPNGLGSYMDEWDKLLNHAKTYHAHALTGKEIQTDWEHLFDKDCFDRVRYACRDYMHAYPEPMANILTALQEMLLQSHDGILRILPAMPTDGHVLFSLAATGGFLVTAERVDGELRCITIESRCGGACRIASPWDSPAEIRRNGVLTTIRAIDGIYTIDTEHGDRLLLSQRDEPHGIFYCNQLPLPLPNQATKHLNRAQLGLDQDF